MRVSQSHVDKFLGRYKMLRLENVDNGWVAYNRQGRKVMNYVGRKSSILLLNTIYTVQERDHQWLEEKLIKAKEGVVIV